MAAYIHTLCNHILPQHRKHMECIEDVSFEIQCTPVHLFCALLVQLSSARNTLRPACWPRLSNNMSCVKIDGKNLTYYINKSVHICRDATALPPAAAHIDAQI